MAMGGADFLFRFANVDRYYYRTMFVFRPGLAKMARFDPFETKLRYYLASITSTPSFILATGHPPQSSCSDWTSGEARRAYRRVH